MKTTGRGKAKKLENDCLDILIYAAKQNGRWVSIKELSEERWIPESTLRTIFCVSKRGYFKRKTDKGYFVYGDVLVKIAKKYKIDFIVKKRIPEHGPKRECWYISAVKYDTDGNYMRRIILNEEDCIVFDGE